MNPEDFDPWRDPRLLSETCLERIERELEDLPDEEPCTKAGGLAFAATLKELVAAADLPSRIRNNPAGARTLAAALKSALETGSFERWRLPVEDSTALRPYFWAAYVAERTMRDWDEDADET